MIHLIVQICISTVFGVNMIQLSLTLINTKEHTLIQNSTIVFTLTLHKKKLDVGMKNLLGLVLPNFLNSHNMTFTII